MCVSGAVVEVVSCLYFWLVRELVNIDLMDYSVVVPSNSSWFCSASVLVGRMMASLWWAGL